MKKEYLLNRATYDSVAKAYAQNAFKKQWMVDYVDKFSQIVKPEGTILDLGCGPGNDAYMLAKKGFRLIGVDFSEKMISEAKKRVPGSEFIVADMLEIEFSPEKFDGIWSVGSLHHIDRDDFEKLMISSMKWLKEGGKVFFSTKSGSGEGVETQIQVGVGSEGDKYWVYWRKNELLSLLDGIGYKILEVTETAPMRKKDLPEGFTESWINVWMEK